MIAELLTFEPSSPVQDLLLKIGGGLCPHSRQRQDQEAMASCALKRIADIVASGGTAKVYSIHNRIRGMVVVGPDEWAFRELGRPGYRIEYLAAFGQAEEQFFVKQLLLREVHQTLPRGTPLVAQVPYADLTSINALERCGFVATQTALILAAEIADTQTPAAPVDTDYGVQPAQPEDIDRLDDGILQVPDGVFGWDAYLPPGIRARVHRDWLQSYARDHSLLLAFHHDRPVGLLAEHICDEYSPVLGYAVGRIDLITTAAEYRNNGVARILMNYAFRQFYDRGARTVELLVHTTGAPSVDQLEARGFTTLGSSLVMTNWRETNN